MICAGATVVNKHACETAACVKQIAYVAATLILWSETHIELNGMLKKKVQHTMAFMQLNVKCEPIIEIYGGGEYKSDVICHLPVIHTDQVAL